MYQSAQQCCGNCWGLMIPSSVPGSSTESILFTACLVPGALRPDPIDPDWPKPKLRLYLKFISSPGQCTIQRQWSQSDDRVKIKWADNRKDQDLVFYLEADLHIQMICQSLVHISQFQTLQISVHITINSPKKEEKDWTSLKLSQVLENVRWGFCRLVCVLSNLSTEAFDHKFSAGDTSQ